MLDVDNDTREIGEFDYIDSLRLEQRFKVDKDTGGIGKLYFFDNLAFNIVFVN